MNRRTFLGTAAVCGGLGVAGCLDSEIAFGDDAAYPRHDRPAYSAWPPAESYGGGGVLFAQLRLQQYPAIQQAVAAGRLDTTNPVAGLSVYGSEQIATAVETLSVYPFGDTLQQAVAAASSPADGTDTDHDQPLFDPASNSTVTDMSEPETADAEAAGIEPERVALFDEVLLFEGSFDSTRIVEQFGDSFEHVDTHRNVAIYEGSDEQAGFAFGLTDNWLLVPTAFDEREADSNTVFAHSVGGYISTVDRIVDSGDGEWLFETTGSVASSAGFWEMPVTDHLDATDIDTSRPGVDAVFDSVESCLCALEPTDETAENPSFETRFSGLYPEESPNNEDLQSAFVGESEPEWLYSETPRAHVTATSDEQ